MAEKIYFTTKDGTKICGDYYFSQSTKGIVLLHMMPATKESWNAFAEKLQKANFQVLAIDLRGHGKSGGLPAEDLSKAGPDGYKNFSEAEHQSSIHDVDAAVEYLKNKEVDELFLGGASIGANLALQYLARHTDAKGAFLLSPGINYRGVQTEIAAKTLTTTQRVFFVGDENDMRSSGDSAAVMSQKLYDVASAQKEIRIFKGAGHGTDIFVVHPELEDELIRWLLQ